MWPSKHGVCKKVKWAAAARAGWRPRGRSWRVPFHFEVRVQGPRNGRSQHRASTSGQTEGLTDDNVSASKDGEEQEVRKAEKDGGRGG